MFKRDLLRRGLVCCLLAAAATCPPAAFAMPLPGDPPGFEGGPAASTALPPAPPAANGGSGFQWDDAGIGAAGAVVLLGTGAAVTGAARRRVHRTVLS